MTSRYKQILFAMLVGILNGYFHLLVTRAQSSVQKEQSARRSVEASNMKQLKNAISTAKPDDAGATEINYRYRRIMNANLQHYHVPVNADILDVETMFVEEDDKIINPLGVKGMGELGMVGIPAAIANVVFT